MRNWLDSWTREHQKNLGIAFIVSMATAIAIDLVLVLVLHLRSISMATWIVENAHPTLITAGALATVGVCWLVRGSWQLVAFAGVMGGHLFAHW